MAARIQRLVGEKTLKDKPITSYIFLYDCYFPSDLVSFDASPSATDIVVVFAHSPSPQTSSLPLTALSSALYRLIFEIKQSELQLTFLIQIVCNRFFFARYYSAIVQAFSRAENFLLRAQKVLCFLRLFLIETEY